MQRYYLQGCGTALLTPFKTDGSVDFDRYAALIDRQICGGIDFLVPLGTTGETPCLSSEERLRLLAIAKEHSAGRPVVVGVGTNSLTATLSGIRSLEPYSPDAFLVVVPYYNKPTQEGLYQYFKAVASSTDKAIVIYNVPGRTGCNISAETTLRLACELENIVAIKEASGNYAQINDIICNRPEGFSVLSGNDNETLSLMASGAQGVISVASNVVPELMSKLSTALLHDDLLTARELHHRLTPLFKALFVESNPIPAKAAMARLGLMENALRLPLVPCSGRTEGLLEEVLSQLDLL